MMGTTPALKELPGMVPVSYSPGLEEPASGVSVLLTTGFRHLTEMLQTGEPQLKAMLLCKTDWQGAPREAERPYPFGLPYFTRTTSPPTLVLPAELSETLQPRTDLTLPLTVWHELAHAFFLQREVVRTPLWLGEFVPQAASAAVAVREELSLEEHLSQAEKPGVTIREFSLPAPGREQMSFQNLLLAFGVATIREFGDAFLAKLICLIRNDSEVLNERRAEELFVLSLGDDGREWLARRGDF